MTAIPEWYRSPFEILNDLGITEPEDIDIEAIAEECGATIRYQPLLGCAARIMGFKDRAIITIEKNTARPRQRFSAGHELGHWMRDRGQVAFQCKNETFVREWSAEIRKHAQIDSRVICSYRRECFGLDFTRCQ